MSPDSSARTLRDGSRTSASIVRLFALKHLAELLPTVSVCKFRSHNGEVTTQYRLERRQARRGLALLGLVGGTIGVGYLLCPRQMSRLAGLPADGRSRWALQMFGVRELLLGLGLFHASRRDDPGEARLFAALTVLSQLG